MLQVLENLLDVRTSQLLDPTSMDLMVDPVSTAGLTECPGVLLSADGQIADGTRHMFPLHGLVCVPPSHAAVCTDVLHYACCGSMRWCPTFVGHTTHPIVVVQTMPCMLGGVARRDLIQPHKCIHAGDVH